jgi:hypothetical protein
MSTDTATFSAPSWQLTKQPINRLLISEFAEKGIDHCMKPTSERLNIV